MSVPINSGGSTSGCTLNTLHKTHSTSNDAQVALTFTSLHFTRLLYLWLVKRLAGYFSRLNVGNFTIQPISQNVHFSKELPLAGQGRF